MKSVLKIFFVTIFLLALMVVSAVAISDSDLKVEFPRFSGYGTNHFSNNMQLLSEEISGYLSKLKKDVLKEDKDDTVKTVEIEQMSVSEADTERKAKQAVVKQDDIKNIVVFGMDSYDLDSYKNSRCDSILVLAVKGDKIVKATSILRDTLVYIPEKEDFNRINSALVYEDSIEDAVSVVEGILGTKIDNYVILNYQSVIKMVDQLGGMLISLKGEEVEWLNDVLARLNRKDTTAVASPFVEKAGYQYLDGKQTLAYMRIRQKGGDVMRVDRQKKVVKYLFTKASKLGMVEIVNLVSLFKDSTVNNIRLAQMVPFMKVFSSNSKMQLENITLPQKGTYEYGHYKNMSVIIADKEKIAKDYNDFISE